MSQRSINKSLAVAIGTVASLAITAMLSLSQAPGAGRGGGVVIEPTPRFADGTVNLGRAAGEARGVWNLPHVINMGAANVFIGATPASSSASPGSRGAAGAAGLANLHLIPQVRGSAAQPWVPFQPWAAAIYDYNQANAMKYDPEGQCMPPGGPRMFATPSPMEIIQSPETKRIWMVFEGGTHIWREIHMDGRPHARNDSIKGLTWLGDSVGHWEGDTLIVDVTNFQEGTWLDNAGHPHTDQLHVIEKFSRPNKRTLHYEALIDDPGAYTKPWSVQWNISWNPSGELKEYICQENNLYLNHLKDDLGNPFIPR